MTFEKDLKDMKEQVLWISGEESPYTEPQAKDRQEHGWWIGGTAWRPVGWSRSERGVHGKGGQRVSLEQDYTWLFERLLPLERDGRPLKDDSGHCEETEGGWSRIEERRPLRKLLIKVRVWRYFEIALAGFVV